MDRQIKLYYQNVRGLRTKAGQFYDNVLNNDFHVYCITETFLTSEQADTDYFSPNYHVFRNDRAGKGNDHGGVLTAVLKDTNLNCLRRYDLEENFEAVWLELQFGRDEKLLLGNIYLSPKLSIEKYNELTALLETHLPIYNHDVILLGDFNIPGVAWSTSDCSGCLSSVKHKAQAIVDFSNFCNLSQINRVANNQGKYLDLCFVKENNAVLRQFEPAVVTIDPYHPSLFLTYTANASPDNEDTMADNRCLYENGDYDALFNSLKSTDWSTLLLSTDVDSAVHIFTSTVIRCMNLFVPKSASKTSRQHIIRLNNHSIANRVADFFAGVAKDQIDSQLFNSTRVFVPKLGSINPGHYIPLSNSHNIVKRFPDFISEVTKDQSDPQLFTSIVRRSMNSFTPKRDAINSGQRAKKIDSNCVAKRFADFFSEMSKDQRDPREAVSDQNITPNNFFMLKITEDDVLKAIRKLKFNTTSGHDGIPNFTIKIGAEILAPILVHIFNLSIKTGRYPKLWKRTLVSLVFKKGSKEDLENYRPISIMCSGAIVMDHVMHDHLYNWFKVYLPDTQHGFVQGRSVETNLLSFSNYIEPFVTKRGQVDTIYVNLSNAFDRVSHQRLLEKLQIHGLSGALLAWCKDYLFQRTNIIKCNGKVTSFYYKFDCGVPLGSSLGPLLFIIYAYDIPPLISETKLFQFGDRQKLVKPIVSESDCVDLQNDLDRLNAWCVSNNVPLNPQKIVVISFSRKVKNVHFNYKLNNITLKRNSSVRDLDLIYDDKLNFDLHVEKIVNKSNKILGRCYSIAKPINSEICFVTLYRAVVLPSIMNGSLIYSNASEIQLSRLETVQKKFIYCLNSISASVTENYENQIKKLNLVAISERLVKADLKFLHRIVNCKIDCPSLLSSLNFNCTIHNLRKRNLLYVKKGSSITLERLMLNHNKFGFSNDIFDRDILAKKNHLIDFNSFVTLIFKLFIIFTHSEN